MTDPNGWPDPKRRGVPLRPAQYGPVGLQAGVMAKRVTAIGSSVPPLVRSLFQQLNASPLHDDALAKLTGYGSTSIRNWRHGRRNMPLSAYEDLANTIGYGLVLRKKEPSK